MTRFWEILPLVLIVFFLLLAGYFFFSSGPWQVSYPVRLAAGGVLLIYAGVRGLFWYRRWKKGRSAGV